MEEETRRTVLVGLAAVAVVLTASLFPAAGLGSHPGGDVGIRSDGGTDDGGPRIDRPGEVDDPDSTPEPTATEPAGSAGTVDPSTPTATPTSTPTPTPDTSGGAGGGGDQGEFWSFSLGVVVTAAASLLFARWVGIMAVHGSRLHLPFGVSVPLPAWLVRLPTRISRATMALLVGSSVHVLSVVDTLGHVFRTIAAGLVVGGPGLVGTVLRSLVAFPKTLATGLGRLTAVGIGIGSLLTAVGRFGRGFRSRGEKRPTTDARAGGSHDETNTGEDGSGPPTVQTAWLAMTELVPVSRSPSTTPAEFARAAIRRGVPEPPVRRLTRAFQAVAYGGQSRSAERLESARAALRRVKEYVEGDR